MLRSVAVVLSTTFFVASPFVERLTAQEPAPIRDMTAKIEAALASPAEMEYLETPLGDVAQDISTRYKIPVTLDHAAFESSDVTELKWESLIHGTYKGVSLESALNRMLTASGLDWTVRDEMLLITTEKGARMSMVTRTYPLGVIDALDGFEKSEFLELINDAVAQPNRGPCGDFFGKGRFAIDENSRSLIATLPYRRHRELAAFLDLLKRCVAEGIKPKETIGVAPRIISALLSKLAQPTEAGYLETPISDVARDLELRHDLTIFFDDNRLNYRGQGAGPSVTLQAKDISLASVLHRITRDHELGWYVADGSVVITSEAAMQFDENLMLRIYPIGDLVEPSMWQSAFPGEKLPFLSLLQTVSDPIDWRDHRGFAVMNVFRPGRLLIVRHTVAGQQRIARLLEEMRAKKSELDREPRTKAAITTPALTTRFYPIADIAVGYQGPIKESTTPLQLRFTDDATVLISTLRGAVLPESWSKSDAAGDRPTVIADRLTQSLVVRQSPRGHAAVGQYLDQLRRDLLKHRPAAGIAPNGMSGPTTGPNGAGEGK